MDKHNKWIAFFVTILSLSLLPLLYQYIQAQQYVTKSVKSMDQSSRHRHRSSKQKINEKQIENKVIESKTAPQNADNSIYEDGGRIDEDEYVYTDNEEEEKAVDEPKRDNLPSWTDNYESCSFRLVETIPDGVFNSSELKLRHFPMHEAWIEIFDLATTSIEIVSYHWGLQKGSGKGAKVYSSLKKAIVDRGVKLSIIHTSNHTEDERYDTVDLMKLAPDLVSVRAITMTKLIDGGGVLHSKLLVVDRKHFYIGSANLSDRGLTKTKEMGIFVKHCTKLAEDAAMLFQVYWDLGVRDRIPYHWPTNYFSKINLVSPLNVLNIEDGTVFKTYLGSSPPAFCTQGRSDDLTIIKHAISTSEQFIYVAVADYVPMNVFGKVKRRWPVLDDLLREAVLQRNIRIRMILSERVYTLRNRKKHLFSLMELNKTKNDTSFVQIKVFHAELSHFRSAHNKYFVTDKIGYIGTSNWSQDYYTRTAGIGFVMESIDQPEFVVEGQSDLRQQLVDVFLRDWNSIHCRPVK